MRIPSPSIPWVGAESVHTRPVSPSPTPSRHGGSVSPTPSALPAQNPLTPISTRRAPYHRNSTTGSPSRHYNTVVAPIPHLLITEQTNTRPSTYPRQPPNVPLTRTSHNPSLPYIEPRLPSRSLPPSPPPAASRHQRSCPLFPLSSPTFALRSANAVAPS